LEKRISNFRENGSEMHNLNQGPEHTGSRSQRWLLNDAALVMDSKKQYGSDCQRSDHDPPCKQALPQNRPIDGKKKAVVLIDRN